MSSVKPGQRAFEKQLRESSRRKSGQQNKANLLATETQSDYALERLRPEQPRDREERALSWTWPCLLAKRALQVSCPPSTRPYGTHLPLTQPGGGCGEETLIEPQRSRVVGKGSQEKPRAMNGFKVKAWEIKKDSVCLSWKLAHGQIKFRSNWGRYTGKHVSLMSLSLFNCLIIYWAKKSGGDSKSHDDEDSDRLSPVQPFQRLGSYDIRSLHPSSLSSNATGMGCTDGPGSPHVAQLLCSRAVFLCHLIVLMGRCLGWAVSLGTGSSSCLDTTSLQLVSGALQHPVLPALHLSSIYAFIHSAKFSSTQHTVFMVLKCGVEKVQ